MYMYVFVNLHVWIYAIDTVLKTEMNLQDTVTEFFCFKGFYYMASSVSGQG